MPNDVVIYSPPLLLLHLLLLLFLLLKHYSPLRLASASFTTDAYSVLSTALVRLLFTPIFLSARYFRIIIAAFLLLTSQLWFLQDRVFSLMSNTQHRGPGFEICLCSPREFGKRLRTPPYTLVVGHILSVSLLLCCDLSGVGGPSSRYRTASIAASFTGAHSPPTPV